MRSHGFPARVGTERNFETDSSVSSEAKGSTRNMLACLRLCLRQHCHVLTLASLLTTVFGK